MEHQALPTEVVYKNLGKGEILALPLPFSWTNHTDVWAGALQTSWPWKPCGKMVILERREPEAWQWWGEKLTCLEHNSASPCNSQRMVFWMGEGTLVTALYWCSMGWLGYPLGFQEGMSFKVRAFHPPWLYSFWVKELFLFLPPPLPLELAYMGGVGQLNPTFFFNNNIRPQNNSQEFFNASNHTTTTMELN